MIKPRERNGSRRHAAGERSPLETALQCKGLADRGDSVAEIAQSLGLSITQVKSMLLLMSAPPAMLDMVTSGMLSTTLAVETLRHHRDDALRIVHAAQALARADGRTRLTRRHITSLLSKPTESPPSAPMRRQAPKTVLRRCVMWVNRNALYEDQNVLRLIAYMGGMDCAEAAKMLERSRKAMRRAPRGQTAATDL